ncbi:MAG: WD40/YVTN/BNR-like repeat-containing protein, partial [Ginsengibacter sp.]
MKKILFLSGLTVLAAHCFSQCDSAFFRQAATSVYDVSLITDKIIVGVGYHGYIIKSTDGGNSWRNIPNNYGDNTLKTVQFTNDSVGYVTGAGGIMKTEDQGESWYPLPFPIDPNFGTTYYDMHFFNKDTGIFVGSNGHILSTIDGGRNFKDTTIGSDAFFSIDFINDSTGLIAGNTIYKTTNGDKTWRMI